MHIFTCTTGCCSFIKERLQYVDHLYVFLTEICNIDNKYDFSDSPPPVYIMTCAGKNEMMNNTSKPGYCLQPLNHVK